MDPLSIAASSTALATFAFKASKAIYTCVDEVKNVDSTLLQLQSEVSALGTSLTSISTTFSSPEVTALHTSKSQSSRLLGSVKPLLDDCERTLEVLGSMLEGIKGKPGKLRDLLRKPMAATRLNFKKGDIEGVRHQVRSYCSAMGMMMNMVGICLSIDGNKQVEFLGDRLEKQLSSLAAQIADVQKKVSEANEETNLDGETVVLDEQQNQHMQECIRTAEVIFTNASVYAGSVAGTVVGDSADVGGLTGIFGSVLGINDDQRERINRWVPGEGLAEDSEEDDDEVERYLFNARLAIARKKLKENNFEAAKAQYEACIGDDAVLETLPLHEIYDLKLELALVYRGLGSSDSCQYVLFELLELEISDAQKLYLKHALSMACLDSAGALATLAEEQSNDGTREQLHKDAGEQLAMSRMYAEEAMRGRKKLLGSRHQSYHDTLFLLVQICDREKDHNSGEVYQYLLPKGYKQSTEWSLTSWAIAPDVKISPEEEKQGPPVPPRATIKASQPEVESVQALSAEAPGKAPDAQDVDQWAEALELAVKDRDLAAVQSYIEKGANINMRYPKHKNQTLLFLAMKEEKIVHYLLDQGADLEATDIEGDTPLSVIASLPSYEHIVPILIQRGAKIEAKSKIGTTPLMWAAYIGLLDSMKALLAADANVNAMENRGQTPLFFAAKNNHPHAVALLLDAGARVNNADTSGDTALILAAEQGYLEVVRLLWERGAEINHANNKKETALVFAAANGRIAVVQLLLEKGAFTAALMALNKAKQGRHHEVVRILKDSEVLGKGQLAVTGKSSPVMRNFIDNTKPRKNSSAMRDLIGNTEPLNENSTILGLMDNTKQPKKKHGLFRKFF